MLAVAHILAHVEKDRFKMLRGIHTDKVAHECNDDRVFNIIAGDGLPAQSLNNSLSASNAPSHPSVRNIVRVSCLVNSGEGFSVQLDELLLLR